VSHFSSSALTISHLVFFKRRVEPLDFSNARAFIDRGDIYFSPNTRRKVAVPQRVTTYPFQDRDLKAYLKPRWYDKQTGFIGFAEQSPSFRRHIFHHVRNFDWAITNIDTPDGPRYALNEYHISNWQFLEDTLIFVIYALNDKWSLGTFIRPPLPSLLGFARKYVFQHSARKRISESLNWFHIWMALLAFLIVNAERKRSVAVS